MLLFTAEQKGSALALNDLKSSRSYHDLLLNIEALAEVFGDLGLASGDTVALLSSNCIEYPELVLAALVSGLWIVPVNWHLQAEEIEYVLSDSACDYLFFGDKEVHLTGRSGDVSACSLSALYAAVGVVRCQARFCYPNDPEQGGDHKHECPAPFRERAFWQARLTASPGGIMLYTSGTTGHPKGVRRAAPVSVGALFEQQSKTGIAFGLDGKGPHLVTGPLYHAAPLLFALYDLVNGAQLLIMAKWDAVQVLALIQRYRIRHSHFVPTMFIRVLRLDEATKQAYDLSSLTVVLHGAAPITPEVKCQMLDWWGDVLFEYWGGSEGGTATLIDPFVWRQHPGSVGQAIPGLEVFALDKAKQQLPAGEVGLLYCQRSDGRAVFEYFNDPIKTAAAHQGAAYTLGDIGYIDEQGFVFLKDRQSRMIISGGVNIYPQELERHLDMLPDLDDSVVFGVPDAEWGEQVAAVIQASGQWLGSDDELIAKVMDHLAPKVASYKLPRHVLVRASLPRQLNGKLYLDPLKQSVIASLAAIERQG